MTTQAIVRVLEFTLDIQENHYVIVVSASILYADILYNRLTSVRKDCWKKTEVQNIINTLNSKKIQVGSSEKVLEIEFSKAVDKELQRQCDVWNSKL